MKNENKIIRCVNIDTNKVKYFPENICTNVWWQKNTRFVPNEPTIINKTESVPEVTEENQSEAVSVTAENVVEIVSVKPKRKYKKRKSNGND